MKIIIVLRFLRSTLYKSFILIALLPAVQAGETTQQQPLIFSILPYKSAELLVGSYKPLADYLSLSTGRQITIQISKDFDSHIKLIGEDKVDIAYMGPAPYVEMVKRYGKKKLLARQSVRGNVTFHGKIIIRTSSPITRLSELAGKRFAFGDPLSTMSHLIPRYMLLQAGVTADALAGLGFLGSHDNVALAVLSGDFDAGAVKEAIYDKYQPRGLRVLASTPALSEHLLIASSRLPANLIKRLRDALFDLKNTSEGLTIMNKVRDGMSAWVDVSDEDYDNLRVILDELSRAGVR